MSVKSAIKWWFGEVQGTLAKKLFLDADTYIDVNNVTIPVANGTTQIDHIIVSRFGIFVIETKNINGWIYGDEKSPQWTQNLFGKKFKFQNPLHQNYRHTRALSDFLKIEHEKFFSVIMFWGESKFKTPMPANVMDRGYTGYIKSKSQVLFYQRFSSTTVCPKCGGALVLRTARSGKHEGGQFYGCCGFPACRYVRSASQQMKGSQP